MKVKFILLVCVLVFLILGCKKKTEDSPNPNPNNSTLTTGCRLAKMTAFEYDTLGNITITCDYILIYNSEGKIVEFGDFNYIYSNGKIIETEDVDTCIFGEIKKPKMYFNRTNDKVTDVTVDKGCGDDPDPYKVEYNAEGYPSKISIFYSPTNPYTQTYFWDGQGNMVRDGSGFEYKYDNKINWIKAIPGLENGIIGSGYYITNNNVISTGFQLDTLQINSTLQQYEYNANNLPSSVKTFDLLNVNSTPKLISHIVFTYEHCD